MGFAPVSQEVYLAVGSWMVCSIGMLVFNKVAITYFPVGCCLVALQMASAALVMIVCCWRSLHIGSRRDVQRWCVVVPFFVGMLLTSILALKNASMTLVICFRALSPCIALFIERLYPQPGPVTPGVLISLVVMIFGASLFTYGLPASGMTGIGWVLLNNIFAIGDRLLQRLMLAKDQAPVDISKTGCAFLNNALGMVPLLAVALFAGEFGEVPAAVHKLNAAGVIAILASCVVGVGISYTGIWAQSVISATTFLVLINASKFVIVLGEAFVVKSKSLGPVQVAGACTTIVGAICYGAAKNAVKVKEHDVESLPLKRNEVPRG